MAQTLFDDPAPGEPAVAGGDGAPASVPRDVLVSGLPEMTDAERLGAELEILGLDASQHLIEFYRDFLRELGTVDACHLLRHRNQSEVLVAGVKVATQTPPVRSGRRVVFLTLDDATGPSDCTFFEDVQGSCAATVFGSWLLVVRGLVRRTGPRGISLRATGAWDLQHLHGIWRGELASTGSRDAAMVAVRREMDRAMDGPLAGGGIVGEVLSGPASRTPTTPVSGVPVRQVGAASEDPSLPVGDRATPAPAFQYADWVPGDARRGVGYSTGRPESTRRQPMPPAPDGAGAGDGNGDDRRADTEHTTRAGGMGRRRVLVHASGFRQSPYADVQPAGEPASQAPPTSVVPPSLEAPRKLWHSSPGSSGR